MREPIRVKITEEFYDEICRVLTWYDYPEDAQMTKEEAAEEVYTTLAKVQNLIAEKL